MCVGLAAVSTPIFDALSHLSSSIYMHRSIDTQISDATNIGSLLVTQRCIRLACELRSIAPVASYQLPS